MIVPLLPPVVCAPDPHTYGGVQRDRSDLQLQDRQTIPLLSLHHAVHKEPGLC